MPGKRSFWRQGENLGAPRFSAYRSRNAFALWVCDVRGFASEKELESGLTASKIRIFHRSAGVAQLVEHFLAKEDVARSNRVTRFFDLLLAATCVN
jgi:hypothetical protein